MDLPYETQFKILLMLPPSSIGSYCNVNTVTSTICRTNAFWSLKSKRDFGITFDMIPGDITPGEKYDLASNIENLVIYLLDMHIYEYLPYLLSIAKSRVATKDDRINYQSILFQIIYDIVSNKSDAEAVESLRLLEPEFIGLTADELADMMRDAYLFAVLSDMRGTVSLLSKYYDWRSEQNTEILYDWINHWDSQNNPIYLDRLAKIGLIPADILEQ